MSKKQKLLKLGSLCITTAITGAILLSNPIYAEQKTTDTGLLEIKEDIELKWVLGDVDNNQKVTMNDVMPILQYALKIDQFEDSWNQQNLFVADYDGSGNVEIKDAQMALEAALKISNEKIIKPVHIYKYADICEEKLDKVSESIKCLKSKEELETYTKDYADTEYGEKLFYNNADFIEYKIPTYEYENGGYVEVESADRGVFVGIVKVRESEGYEIKWIQNYNNLLLYVIEKNPIEGGKEKYLATYMGMESVILNETKVSSIVVPYNAVP